MRPGPRWLFAIEATHHERELLFHTGSLEEAETTAAQWIADGATDVRILFRGEVT